MKKRLPLAVAAIATLMLAGCAQIPQKSAVLQGPNINGGLTNENLYYSPTGPVDGDSPADIINGFISAGTGPQNDYQVAREYLSRDFASKWNPVQQTLVQTGHPTLTQTSTDGVFELKANVTSRVSASGEYREGSTTEVLRFGLTQEAGQWRIKSAPNLTILIKPVFDVIFQAYSVYFLDKPQQHLVPDVRWFPSRANTGTRLVSAILQGPTAWLAPAVSSAIPAGTKLNTASVTVKGGVATVDLNSKALKTNAFQRSLIQAQLAATLNQLPSVLDVDILVDRSLQKISRSALLSTSAPGSTAYSLAGGHLYQQSDFGSDAVTEFDHYLTNFDATDFAVSEDLKQLALVGKGGLAVAYPGTRAATLRVVDKRQSLAAPLLDSYRLIWSLSHDAGHGIRVFNGQLSVASFTPGWMRGLGNKQFSLSPDETRLLVSGHRSNTSYLYAVGVSRNGLGVPTLAPVPKLLLSRPTEGIMANWVSDVDFVYNTYSTTGTSSPVLQTIGGTSIELPSFNASVALAASSGGRAVYLVTSNSDLYAMRNQGWVFLRKGVSAVHFAH